MQPCQNRPRGGATEYFVEGRALLNLIQDSGVTTLIKNADFVALVNGIKEELKGIPDDSYILGGVRESYQFG